jgi:esterase/lipase superfamily enzyme
MSARLGVALATRPRTLGAFRAANPLFKHPDRVKRCYALSGVYDLRYSMDGMYDDNFYFNNPVDYMANQNDPWFSPAVSELRHSLRHRLWPVGSARPNLPNVRRARDPADRSSPGRLGPERRTRMAPHWHHQMWEYVGAHF